MLANGTRNFACLGVIHVLHFREELGLLSWQWLLFHRHLLRVALRVALAKSDDRIDFRPHEEALVDRVLVSKSRGLAGDI